MKSEFIMFHFKDDAGNKRTLIISNGLDLDSYIGEFLGKDQDQIVSLIKQDTGIIATKPILATLFN